MTRATAVNWGEKGIRVNGVKPGPTESRMMTSIKKGAPLPRPPCMTVVPSRSR
ncbi:SDR family oxidoreductase [Pseudotabrizicola sediminis]|uniref:SDR family oxidoreductase n=1 Tax=Pseudotabrizicola sediminis TaxID=2486418 RepID=A0ABY2KJR1_9RHOB|nr:SDR family oxidoreductase [Pseudotabrizicola sediminis]